MSETNFIDEIMGFNPQDLTVFNEPVSNNQNVNIYKTNPKLSKSEDGKYRSVVRIIYNPFDVKRSVVPQATYAMTDFNGFFMVKSMLGVLRHVQSGSQVRHDRVRPGRQDRARRIENAPSHHAPLRQGPGKHPGALRPQAPADAAAPHESQGHRAVPMGAHHLGRGLRHHRKRVQPRQGRRRPGCRDVLLRRPQGATPAYPARRNAVRQLHIRT